MPVARATGRLEQSTAKWNKLERKIGDLADMTAAVKIGCSWCMDTGDELSLWADPVGVQGVMRGSIVGGGDR